MATWPNWEIFLVAPLTVSPGFVSSSPVAVAHASLSNPWKPWNPWVLNRANRNCYGLGWFYPQTALTSPCTGLVHDMRTQHGVPFHDVKRPVDIHSLLIHVFSGRIYPRVLEYSEPRTESRRAAPTQLVYNYTQKHMAQTGVHTSSTELYSRFQT
jgi:hypothetical protein